MPKKLLVKMTVEEVEDLLYLIDEEVGREHMDLYPGAKAIMDRIILIQSTPLPEFIEGE